ncbi:hypothetical protein BZA05DRAFT_22718 [Tricharina praecox]|uniref:uncharacterized protein n=1 Tax=Tricharina praecox TaxID=43433 RepID=UPI00221F58C7|nr:uncharacterized protein BZA05DRAFT_22718 [Tricharina praecox]KAI5859152.1 hypothetical protein BZA05DRAFT_22718 [Tricharina praecox]
MCTHTRAWVTTQLCACGVMFYCLNLSYSFSGTLYQSPFLLLDFCSVRYPKSSPRIVPRGCRCLPFLSFQATAVVTRAQILPASFSSSRKKFALLSFRVSFSMLGLGCQARPEQSWGNVRNVSGGRKAVDGMERRDPVRNS